MTCSERLEITLLQTNVAEECVERTVSKKDNLSLGKHRHINTISFSALSVTQQGLVLEKVELAIHVRATSTILLTSNKYHEVAAPRLPRCC